MGTALASWAHKARSARRGDGGIVEGGRPCDRPIAIALPRAPRTVLSSEPASPRLVQGDPLSPRLPPLQVPPTMPLALSQPFKAAPGMRQGLGSALRRSAAPLPALPPRPQRAARHRPSAPRPSPLCPSPVRAAWTPVSSMAPAKTGSRLKCVGAGWYALLAAPLDRSAPPAQQALGGNHRPLPCTPRHRLPPHPSLDPTPPGRQPGDPYRRLPGQRDPDGAAAQQQQGRHRHPHPGGGAWQRGGAGRRAARPAAAGHQVGPGPARAGARGGTSGAVLAAAAVAAAAQFALLPSHAAACPRPHHPPTAAAATRSAWVRCGS